MHKFLSLIQILAFMRILRIYIILLHANIMMSFPSHQLYTMVFQFEAYFHPHDHKRCFNDTFLMQASIEAEQQKVLLQQVMNLTHEQINSLPPEQRQQVLQLQQAFRSQANQLIEHCEIQWGYCHDECDRKSPSHVLMFHLSHHNVYQMGHVHVANDAVAAYLICS